MPLRGQTAGFELSALIIQPKLDLTAKSKLGKPTTVGQRSTACYMQFLSSPKLKEAQQGELLCSHQFPPRRSISQEAGTRPSYNNLVPVHKILPSFLGAPLPWYAFAQRLTITQLSSASKSSTCNWSQLQPF